MNCKLLFEIDVGGNNTPSNSGTITTAIDLSSTFTNMKLFPSSSSYSGTTPKDDRNTYSRIGNTDKTILRRLSRSIDALDS